MTSAHNVLATLVLISSSFSVLGQSETIGNNRFAEDGLAFNYPKTLSITDEIIWLRTRFRLVGLVYISNDLDEPSNSKVWEIIRGGLTIDSPVIMGTTTNPNETDNQNITGGVLNGKALILPPPPYSPVARAARVSGEVQVQVVIDEFGNVISAHAISRHPLLQAACLQAAGEVFTNNAGG